ncbi:hypothetical protein D3C72_1688580 [compost metagenome]
MGQIRVEAVKHRLTEANRHVFGNHADLGTNGVALFLQRTHQFIQGFQLIGIRAEERVLFNLLPIFQLADHVADLRQIAAHLYAIFLQQVFLGNSPCRNAHGGFTSRRTTTAAIIAHAVFLLVGVICMPRTEHVFDSAVIL